MTSARNRPLRMPVGRARRGRLAAKDGGANEGEDSLTADAGTSIPGAMKAGACPCTGSKVTTSEAGLAAPKAGVASSRENSKGGGSETAAVVASAGAADGCGGRVSVLEDSVENTAPGGGKDGCGACSGRTRAALSKSAPLLEGAAAEPPRRAAAAGGSATGGVSGGSSSRGCAGPPNRPSSVCSGPAKILSCSPGSGGVKVIAGDSSGRCGACGSGPVSEGRISC